MSEKGIEDGSGRGEVTQKLSPILRGSIRGDQCRGRVVPSHEDFQQAFLRGGTAAHCARQIADGDVNAVALDGLKVESSAPFIRQLQMGWG